MIYDVEENKKENCKSTEEFKPSKELICTLDHFGPSMGISFDFKIDTFDMPGSGEWRGMLHFREKAAKGWFGSVGTRVPAFYVNVKTKVVRVFYALDNNGAWKVDSKPLNASQWYRVEFMQYQEGKFNDVYNSTSEWVCSNVM